MKILSLLTKRLPLIALLLTGAVFPLKAHAGLLPSVSEVVLGAVDFISSIPFYFMYVIAWIMSQAMGLSLKWFVFEMGSWINGIDSVRYAWTLCRDLANLGFIFILLWAAITTILGQQKQVGKIVGSLAIVAILINFSFFAVAVVADFTNYLTFEIYDNITVETIQTGSTTATRIDTEKLTTAIMNTSYFLRVQIANQALNQFQNAGVPQSAKDEGTVTIQNEASSKRSATLSNISGNLLSAIMMAIIAFVFGSTALLLARRFIELLVAMIISPIMLSAVILPQTKGKFTEWAKKVGKQAIWAPIFMFILYVALQILNDSSFLTKMEGESGNLQYPAVIMRYLIVCATLLGALFSAKKIGAAGFDFATKVAGGAMMGTAAWAGRHTIGRGSAMYLRGNKDRLIEQSAERGIKGAFARTQLKKLENMEKGTFDFRNTKGGKAFSSKLGFNLGDSTKQNFKDMFKEKEQRIEAARDSMGKMSKEEEKEYNEKKKAYDARVQSFKKPHNAARDTMTKKHAADIGKVSNEVDKIDKDIKTLLAGRDESALDPAEAAALQTLKDDKEKKEKERKEMGEAQLKEFKSLVERQQKEIGEEPSHPGKARQQAFEAKLKGKRTLGQLINQNDPLSRVIRKTIDKKIEAHKQKRVAADKKVEDIGKQIAEEKKKGMGANEALIASLIKDQKKAFKEGWNEEAWSRYLEALRTPFGGGRGALTDDQVKALDTIRKDVKAQRMQIKAALKRLARAKEQLASAQTDAQRAEANKLIEKSRKEYVEAEQRLVEQRLKRRKLGQQYREERREQGTWITQRKAAKAAPPKAKGAKDELGEAVKKYSDATKDDK